MPSLQMRRCSWALEFMPYRFRVERWVSVAKDEFGRDLHKWSVEGFNIGNPNKRFSYTWKTIDGSVSASTVMFNVYDCIAESMIEGNQDLIKHFSRSRPVDHRLFYRKHQCRRETFRFHRDKDVPKEDLEWTDITNLKNNSK